MKVIELLLIFAFSAAGCFGLLDYFLKLGFLENYEYSLYLGIGGCVLAFIMMLVLWRRPKVRQEEKKITARQNIQYFVDDEE